MEEKMISCFEHLPNELIYKIFRYFDYLNIHTAFSNLNRRFSEFINNDSNFPIAIHLSSMSKQVLKRYNETIIEPNKHRIRSIYISNEFMHEIIFPTHEKLPEFTQIEALNVTIEGKYLEKFLEQLHSLPLLSSLVITTDYTKNVSSIYSKIFLLPKLKYCKTTLSNYVSYNWELPFCTRAHSSIERFIITDIISFEAINNLISYVLQLRYLSLYLSASLYNQTPPIFWTLLQHLTYVSLKLCNFHFAFVKQLAIDVFPNVQTFHLRSERAITTEQLNANQWQQLIQSYLLNLRVFDIEFDVCISNNNQQLQFEIEFNQFQTSFWTERKWFFSSIVDANERDIIFYSKQPYTRKQCYKLTRLTNEFNLDVIEHIEISDEKTLKKCSNYFPKIKELTMTDDYCMSNILICDLINRIMPLKQLTKLSLTCENMSFKKLVEVLSYTLNLRELRFRSMLGYTQYQATINENELFQSVSKTNQIMKLDFQGETSLTKVQLFLKLCPRIQDLSMHVYRRDFEEIALFLLNPKNSQCLNNLSLDRGDLDPPSTASYLIRKNKFFDDYSYRAEFRGEHIWWC